MHKAATEHPFFLPSLHKSIIASISPIIEVHPKIEQINAIIDKADVLGFGFALVFGVSLLCVLVSADAILIIFPHPEHFTAEDVTLLIILPHFGHFTLAIVNFSF